MPPICAGQYSATAIMSPLASAMAQLKSKDSLKIVEYDVFIMVIPISRQMESIVDSTMFIVTTSMGSSALHSPIVTGAACSAQGRQSQLEGARRMLPASPRPAYSCGRPWGRS